MRILQVTPLYYPSLGGVERCVQAISIALTRLGHEVVVATMAHDNRLPRREIVQGVQVRRFPGVGPLAYRVPIGLFTYLLKHKRAFDLVHAHNYGGLALLLAVIACRRRAVVSLYYHGRGHSHIADLMHRVYDPLATRTLRWVSGVICTSAGEAGQVAHKLGVSRDRITIVPCGVTTFNHEASGEGNGCLVLSVGRLEAYKRVDRLLTALPHLPKDYTMAVVGCGPERNGLERLAQALGVCRRVQFLGKIGDEELCGWYKRARVVASLSEGESFGIAVLEALASGCQVVCSDIPAFRDFSVEFPHRVSLVAPETSGEELAALIQAAMARPRQGAIDLQDYSWPKITADLLKVYRRVAALNGTPAAV